MALEKLGVGLDQQRFKARQVNRFVSTETQLLALKLAQMLDDNEHKELYLHLSKYLQTGLLEQAASFVSDAQARDRGKLFSWKVKQLRQEWLAAGKNPYREVKKKTKRKKKPQQLPLFGN
jgi:hypothetical protein